MENINDGGPAFPRTSDAINYKNRDFDLDGMSLRDYFAGQALMGICANPDCSAPTYLSSDHKLIAKNAYSIADAMLKERSKNG